MAYGFAPITITASTTLDRDMHANGPLIKFGDADGATLTLPAAVGNGDRYRFLVAVTVTSNSDKIQVANATDVMTGMIFSAVTTTAAPWQTTSTSDTITLNGTTTGGIKGDYIEIEDAASGLWRVLGHTLSTGTQATPFSAAVS
jgi:hypothetical protein